MKNFFKTIWSILILSLFLIKRGVFWNFVIATYKDNKFRHLFIVDMEVFITSAFLWSDSKLGIITLAGINDEWRQYYKKLKDGKIKKNVSGNERI